MEAAVVGAVAGVGSGILGGVTVGVGVGIVAGGLTAAVKTWMIVPTPAAEEEPKKPKKKFVKPEPKVEEPEEEEKEKGLSAGQKRRLLEKKKKDEAKAKEEEAKKAAAAQKKANKGKAKGGKPEAKDNKAELSAAGSPAIKGAAAPAVKAAAAAPAKSAAAPPAKTSAAEPAEDGKKKKKKKKPAAKAADEPASADSGAAPAEQATGVDEWQQQPSQLREKKRGEVAAQKRAEADAKKAAAGAQSVSEAFEVPSKDHGLVIGKKGAMLELLQSKTFTVITVPKKESGQQYILIEGERRNIELAKKAIRQIIDTGISDVTHPDTIANEIEIPASASGLLVGPRGDTRKLIESKCNVKIQIPEKDENSKTAVIKLTGSDHDVNNARLVIRSLVEDGFSLLTHPDWVKVQVVFPQSHLKHLFGPKGESLQRLQKATKTRINVPTKEERAAGPYANANTIIITIVGPNSGVEEARVRMSETAAIVEEDMTPVLLPPEAGWAGPAGDLSAQNEW